MIFIRRGVYGVVLQKWYGITKVDEENIEWQAMASQQICFFFFFVSMVWHN